MLQRRRRAIVDRHRPACPKARMQPIAAGAWPPAGHEARADRLAGDDATQDISLSPGGNDRGDPGHAGQPCRLQLGHHASRAEAGRRWPRQGLDGGVEAHHQRDQAGAGILTRIGVEEPGHVAEQQQNIGIDQRGDHGREAIVVAEAQLVVGHDVVFVDDGDHAPLQQGQQRTSRAEIPGSACYVALRQQCLGDHQSVPGKGALIGAHETRLPHGRQHLPAGDVGTCRHLGQQAPPGRHGAGADQQDGASILPQGGDAGRDTPDKRLIQQTIGARQQRTPQLDDDSPGIKAGAGLGSTGDLRPCAGSTDGSARAVVAVGQGQSAFLHAASYSKMIVRPASPRRMRSKAPSMSSSSMLRSSDTCGRGRPSPYRSTTSGMSIIVVLRSRIQGRAGKSARARRRRWSRRD